MVCRARPSRTSLAGLVLGALVALLLSACSLPWSGPDAGASMDRLASALTRGDIAKVAFTSGDGAEVQKSFAQLTAGIGKAHVTAGRVSTSGDHGTGQLTWRWQVGSHTWTYDTDVTLTKGSSAWLVTWSPTIVSSSLEKGERLVETTIAAQRGNILGAGGNPIVMPRPVLRVGLDKTGLTPARALASARRLGPLLDIDTAGFVKQVRATGDKAFVQGIVFRRQDAQPSVLARLSSIPGARAISDKLPLAPTKDFAAAILGTVGPATAELVKDSKGRIKAGDDVGLSGLQKRYDAQLAGTRGASVAAVDDHGQRRTLFTADPKPGTALRTTLDPKIEQVAQQALANVGPASALVAIRPSTGDLVAIASGPGSKGYNTATYGRYAPGSTFKIITSLALLRSGLKPSSPVTCPTSTVVDGKTFKNDSDYPPSANGRITLEDALANSCNTAFIGQRDRIGHADLVDAAAALGFGVDHETGFPTFFGSVDAPGSETSAAASMIGQGAVLASPMAMATVVASVVKGSVVVPQLLPSAKAAKPAAPAKPLTASEDRSLRAMMRAVVERGTGAGLQGVPGGPVIAKTGTAEFGDTPPLETHAWMVAGRGDLAVAVFVDKGTTGAGTAGPILRQFLEQVRR